MIVLKYALNIRGLGPTDLAKQIGSTMQLIQKWFKGSRPIPNKYYEGIEEFQSLK